MPGVSRPDPFVREQDYCACLKYYVRHHDRIRRIVWIENSGWPLDQVRKVIEYNPHHKEVELISLRCNQFPRSLGKSYGEMLMLDQGLAASKLAVGARYLAKLTGRNYLTNLTRILESPRQSFGLFCDIRDHGIFEMLRIPACGRHCDTRFFVFTPEFYDVYLRGQYRRLNDGQGYMVENLLYELAKDPRCAGQVIRRFPMEPDFRGLAGHLGKDYGSRREVLKRRVRGLARRLTPWLHI
jgi:hypothetical protein